MGVFVRTGVTGTRLASRAQFSRHTHDAFGIGVIERGAQKSWSGHGPVEAGSGDVITVNPGEVHDGAPIGSGERRWKMLYFEPELIDGLAQDLTEARSASLEFKAPVFADHAVLRRSFLTLFGKLAKGHEVQDVSCETLLLRLLTLMSAHAPRSGVPDIPVRRAKEFIDDNPAHTIRLNELARLTGTSKFQFLRAFTRTTGLTPHSYIVQARLKRARRLIAAGEPIADVALSCGFTDQSHLTRAFARSYGFTPGRLRAQFPSRPPG